MRYFIIYSELAKKDILTIYEWLENQQNNLGSKFINSIEKTESVLHKIPLGFENRFKNTREIKIIPFNYLLIYTIEEATVYVHAVFPEKSNPLNKYKSLKKKEK